MIELFGSDKIDIAFIKIEIEILIIYVVRWNAYQMI